MTLSSASNFGLVVTFVICLFPALAAFVALVIVSRVRGDALSMVPGWLAAAAIAPVLATFFGVRMIINAFRMLGFGGGGLGALSAGMWEATQPLAWASWVACALAIVTFVLSIRGLVDADEDETAGSTKGVILSIVIIVVAFAAVVWTATLFHDTSRVIIDVADPRAPQQIDSVADVSQRIASRLMTTAVASVVMTLLLLIAVVVSALSSHTRPSIARVLVFLSLVAALGFAATALVHRSWAARLHQTAVTGQFPR